MRVAYVSTCGSGHLNTIRASYNDEASSRLFLMRFADESIPFIENAIVLTCNQTRPSEEARVFNAIRATALQDALHVWLHDYAPSVIVYDFFCIEAREVARLLGVPAICSIPATLKPDETTTCSDALLPAEHYYWVWRDPYPVSIGPVAFLGPRSSQLHMPVVAPHAHVTVVTFGTVVPYYSGCKERYETLLKQVYELVQRFPQMHYVFAGIQGPACSNCTSLMGHDLVALLEDTKPECLIFHGGGNTYAEALAARVPRIVVCPFFGDQFETARQEGNVYSGNLVDDVIASKPHVYAPQSPTRPMLFEERFPVFWRAGDLLFGHRRHRDALQQLYPEINLHLGKYAPFASFADPASGELPAIADVYNDEPATELTRSTPYHTRLHRIRETRTLITDKPEDHRLVHYCLEILELTVREWGGRIHFVVGALDELGPATRIELEYIKTNWVRLKDVVLFYDTRGRRVPAPFSCPKKKDTHAECESLELDAISRPLSRVPGRMPFIVGRRKSPVSVSEKVENRRLPLLDHHGWRTGYLNQADLRFLQCALEPNWRVSVNWCDQRVWYYYYYERTEVQLWPWVYLHHFYLNQAGVETDLAAQREMQDDIERRD